MTIAIALPTVGRNIIRLTIADEHTLFKYFIKFRRAKLCEKAIEAAGELSYICLVYQCTNMHTWSDLLENAQTCGDGLSNTGLHKGVAERHTSCICVFVAKLHTWANDNTYTAFNAAKNGDKIAYLLMTVSALSVCVCIGNASYWRIGLWWHSCIRYVLRLWLWLL